MTSAGASCRLRKLDSAGNALVEFALVAPLFLGVLVAVFDIARLIVTTISMEIAVREAARVGRTTAPDGSTGRATSALAAAVEKLILRPDPDDVSLAAAVYTSFTAVAAAEPFVDTNSNGKFDSGEKFNDVNANGAWDGDSGKAGFGDGGEIVLYRLSYHWEPIVAWHRLLGLDDWGIDLETSVVVQNEDFSGSAP